MRAPGFTRALVDGDCPQGVGHADRTGPTRLEVTADGPWRVEVAQRIDFPLVELPLASMTAPTTAVLASGSFYKVDKVGVGKVRIFEDEAGYSVRLEDFWVTPKTALQLRFSTAESPKTSAEYLSSRSQLLSVLDVTSGSLNYVAPNGVDPEGFRSVVIWSPSENSVYSAARLEPPA
ncbi:MAG: DM13 domain-containing protein [Pseudonocardiaceae bacterium]